MKLDPLRQRLRLYRFAGVHVLSGEPLSPLRWGLPHLEACRGNRHWAETFRDCRPYRAGSEAPVLAGDLASLQRIRIRHPKRPLIFVQSAFERLRKPKTLARLCRAEHPVTELLDPHDFACPLFWLDRWPSGQTTTLQVYGHFDDHPLRAKLDFLRRHHPGCRFTIREDGLILEQLPLFQATPHKPVPSLFDRHERGFSRALAHQLKPFRGIHYVLATNSERLRWFQRDCLRVLGNRCHCWNFPEAPDPRDPLLHFVLASDRAIRHARLDGRYPLLHLDGNRRHWHYRQARHCLDQPGLMAWCAPPIDQTLAWLDVRGEQWCFEYRQDAWHCAARPHPNGENRSADFHTRLQALARLRGTG